MKKLTLFVLVQMAVTMAVAQTLIKTDKGQVEGVTEKSGVISFKGIPFAQPPIGDLRWKDPQPANNWGGIRKCDAFGYNPMQKKVFGDMGFRSPGMSEDCLYLNVWVPAKKTKRKCRYWFISMAAALLPVMARKHGTTARAWPNVALLRLQLIIGWVYSALWHTRVK
jgi:carboxylesterase type B